MFLAYVNAWNYPRDSWGGVVVLTHDVVVICDRRSVARCAIQVRANESCNMTLDSCMALRTPDGGYVRVPKYRVEGRQGHNGAAMIAQFAGTVAGWKDPGAGVRGRVRNHRNVLRMRHSRRLQDLYQLAPVPAA